MSTTSTTETTSDEVAALRAEVQRLRTELATLESAKREAERSSSAKSGFISHITHELRTPMNGILGMTRLALETDLSAEQREYLETVQTAADSLLTLINDLLDHTKIDAGRMELEQIPFRLADTIRNAVRGVRVLADHKGISLETDIDDTLPEILLGDPTRLRQVVLNLVGNAVKFTDEGGVVVSVGMARFGEESVDVSFAVTDTGIGIPAHRLEAIFDVFGQADPAIARRYGGSGLGLAISRQLVELMGGELTVDSEVDAGSTFRFTVPLGVASATRADTEPANTDGKAVEVVVLSDSPVNRASLVEVLGEGPYAPRFFEDPDDLVERVRRLAATDRKPGLIVLDVQREGLDLAWQLRREAHDTPMILVTPSGQRGDAARCRELGIGGFLTGPVVVKDLADTIQAVLAGTPDLITRYWLREHRRSISVLVADDSSTNRLLVARLLEKRGHSVVGVANGEEAVAAVSRRGFDVVLMDIHMPVMDGYEATAAIRALPGSLGGTPIIALTGSVNEEGRRRCLESGMDAYIGKPFKVETLLSLIEDLTRVG